MSRVSVFHISVGKGTVISVTSLFFPMNKNACFIIFLRAEFPSIKQQYLCLVQNLNILILMMQFFVWK